MGQALSASEAKSLISKEKKYADVVFPFLIANNLIGTKTSKPTRYVIDFLGFDVLEAAAYPKVFDRIKARVLPARQAAAAKEKNGTRQCWRQIRKQKPIAITRFF